MRFLLTVILLLLRAATDAQEPPPGMSNYQVVLLRRGPAAASPEIMKAHLAHLEKLEKEGVLAGAGPIADRESEIRGLLIMKAAYADAVRMAARDPAVKAGGLVPEVLPWWGPDNIGERYFATMEANPSAQPTMKTYQLVLLHAGPVRPGLETIHTGHQIAVETMVTSSKLLAAGPFLQAGALRGLLVIDATAEEARSLVAAHPVVTSGHLVLDLRPWMVAEGVFTRRAAP